MVEEHFVNNGGVKIRYLDNRPDAPAGLPVLFSTGVMDRADDYVEIFDLFGDRRLVIVDPRGRGGSDAPTAGYSSSDQAGDLAAAIDDAGFDRFHLMTFSRGTISGLVLTLDHPDRVASASIGDYTPAEISVPPALVERLMATTWRGSPAADRIPHHALEGISRDCRPRELWDELAALGIPVLAAAGEKGVVDEERRHRYLERIPGAEVVVVPGAGHDIFRPDRGAYPRLVLDFIARRAPGT